MARVVGSYPTCHWFESNRRYQFFGNRLQCGDHIEVCFFIVRDHVDPVDQQMDGPAVRRGADGFEESSITSVEYSSGGVVFSSTLISSLMVFIFSWMSERMSGARTMTDMFRMRVSYS